MWITPTADTIKARITGPEFSALKDAARAPGQSADSIVSMALDRVVTLIRGYVGSKHTLGPVGTIPDELESALGALWVSEFITRIPNSGKMLDDRRKDAADAAMQQLRDVASGRFAIVPPETPAPPQSQAAGPAVSLVSSAPRRASPGQTDGLF